MNQSLWTRGIVGVLFGLIAVGCTSTPKPKTEQPTLVRKAISQQAVLKQYARWLPGDSIGVAVIDVAPLMDTYFSGFHLNTKDRAQAEAAIKKAKAELGQLSIKRIGLDLTKARQIIIGAGPTWVSIVVTGLKTERAIKDTTKLGSLEAWPLKSVAKRDAYGISSLRLWGATIGKDVVLLSNKKQALETISTNPKLGLKHNTGLLERFEGLMNNGPTRLNAAILTDNVIIKNVVKYGLGLSNVPDDITLTVEDKRLSLRFHAPDETLKALRKRMLDQHDRVSKFATEREASRKEKDIFSATLLTMGHYQTKSRRALLTPEVNKSTMTYQFELFDTPIEATSFVLGNMTSFWGALLDIQQERRRYYPLVRKGDQTLRQMISSLKKKLEMDQKAGPLATCDSTIVPVTSASTMTTKAQLTKHNFSAAWKPYGFEGERQVRFSYSVNKGYSKKSLRFRAQTDFKPGKSKHTIEIGVVFQQAKDGRCTIRTTPSVTMYQFE